MNILFVHQNFPAQFRHVAEVLATDPRHEVRAIAARGSGAVAGVVPVRYAVDGAGLGAVHSFARRFDVECRRAEEVVYAATGLAASGFVPDTVVSHCGWGESLPLRALFPRARLVTYLEYFYREAGLDVGFDPEAGSLGVDGAVALRVRNAATLLALAEADVAVSPTEWQRSTFPERLRPLVTVCHDGIDTASAAPDPAARVRLADGTVLRPGDEVVTFVARNLEPMRGYHVFLRALPQILRERPRARVLIVGGDGLSYGAPAPGGRSWKSVILDEVRSDLDVSRLHFMGWLDRPAYLAVLQVSAVHVYLTYPFVLSWSLLEAMAAGCLVVGSSTGPVREVMDDTNGVPVDFFDRPGLARATVAALADPARFAERRRRARTTVLERYERADCVARLLALMGVAPSA